MPQSPQGTQQEQGAEGSWGTLYMIPSPLHPQGLDHLGPVVRQTLGRLRHFAVENERPTRRYLRAMDPEFPIDSCNFIQLDKRTEKQSLDKVLQWVRAGMDVGMISDAGCPGIADPGALLVARIQESGGRVFSLTGPSSFTLALMGSGFSGQSFRVVGYLPIDHSDRRKHLLDLEQRVKRYGETQIFMETPYRNRQLMDFILKTLDAHTKLCVAADLTGPASFIKTKTLGDWKNAELPTLHKVPAVFLLGK